MSNKVTSKIISANYLLRMSVRGPIQTPHDNENRGK